MEKKLVFDIIPTKGNSRNSEGAFLRIGKKILFAYSRFSSDDWADASSSDIALIISSDEGESWSEPRIIAKASDFGVANIMSVSKAVLPDGRNAFYFIIKENDGTSGIGRAATSDGKNFEVTRCVLNAPSAYYVFNNDRFCVLSDGKIAFPAAMTAVIHNPDGRITYDSLAVSVVFTSADGKVFDIMPPRLTICSKPSLNHGMQEPGIIELKNGIIWLWARTECSYQYESYSFDGMKTFTEPSPSIFTSPCSPMEIERDSDGALYAVYNPTPNYNGRKLSKAGWGRTPFVIRKSTDDGKSWGNYEVIEDDEDRGFCYPSLFFTNDNCILCAYCRGGTQDTSCLSRLGIMKISK